MTIIIFIIVLAILILVHEFGHFLFAKKTGMRVDEFGLGFPPKIFSKKFGETEYSLNIIPFGGFVRIFGEKIDKESEDGKDSSRSFVNRPKWAQAIVLFAGVFFNFILALVLIVLAFNIGVPASSSDYSKYKNRMTDFKTVVMNVVPGTPAYDAGFKIGDKIINIKDIVVSGSQSSSQIKTVIEQSLGNEINFLIERSGENINLKVKPQKGIIQDQKEKYAIGFVMDDVGTLNLPFHLSLWEGTIYTLKITKIISLGLIEFIWQAITGSADYSSVTGPIGIASMVGDAARAGFVNLIMFMSLISINLAVINLIPFPALDGGRLIIVAFESIFKKRISTSIYNSVNAIGFVLLLILMIVVTYKDIVRIF